MLYYGEIATGYISNFIRLYMYCILLGQKQQLCGGSSPAFPNRDGSGSSQHMEAYRYPIKNPKGSGQRPLKDERR